MTLQIFNPVVKQISGKTQLQKVEMSGLKFILPYY